eukprot:CAMPEP_0176366380 /NCGR_PEP_ID=MMETSP0126-20121128/21139_1 /TAXON_ID=141414 ORGANISM="Strombidinopsis acuminatum, Strain SPMC142" /NCGR_SAMPLE_ID=MMETSP0126 /ASSEMBLY_ACC=CAM_ASM_000229 /LENGTH=113 /DNA_ID=CAMNT_0017723777 /DNA_START=1136 /DNA_END=1477 /DNA_ORIENTATION=+
MAAMLVCLGHGANDVANSISPMIIALKVEDPTSSGNMAYLIGSCGIALGLLTLGYRVMETVGKKVIALDFFSGYCAQLATAFSIMCGTLFGLPLSTTHCMVGALFGLALSRKT